ncbi:MAG: copper oxidase [Acidocella sp. 20-57-95]|nr:MAG: copper oxidase [Acidocella sp. 20-57-95]OYV59731.1 MAG: copper oxidase [Acidocella sp. 21-58-7]HQT65710.1 multicopper oxidase family protein [Acidocella sp.]
MKTTRRELFLGATAFGFLGSLPAARAQTSKVLTATTRSLEVNGKAARVFALLGPNGDPGVTLDPGERFAVKLKNQVGTPTIIHWHGQEPDWKQDGFPWPETPAIAAGSAKSYDYKPISGTFWMHSHAGLQEQQLMTAPLIVRDIASLSADTQDIVLMLHDFSFKTPNELLAGLTKNSAMGGMDGMGSGGMSNMSGMSMGASGTMMGPAMNGMDKSTGSMTGMSGAMSGSADLNDIDYDAFLANERSLADPEIVRVPAGQAVRLRVINGSASTNFWIDLEGISGQVVAADGRGVVPVSGSRFPIAMAQRLDILFRVPNAGSFPILAQVEGKTDRTGIIIATPGASIPKIVALAAIKAPPTDLSLESRLTAANPLVARPIDMTLPLMLDGDMSTYAWTLNGKQWPNPKVLIVNPGQRVMIDMTNQSMMSHPMHLHGHSFQVVALNGKPINGALRDTVLVPPMGNVKIAFDATNPGRWALHCHNLYHMAGGMMTEVRYSGIAV